MTSGVWGADPVELRALAKNMDSTAGQLSSILSTLTVQINSASGWVGPDAEGFRAEWNTTHRTSILGANSILSAAATALARNASEQEQASAADAPGSGGGRGGPSGAASPGSPVPGLTNDQNSLLYDLLNDPTWLGAEDLFDNLAVVDLFSRLTQLRLTGSFSSLESALNFNRFASGFETLNDFLGGKNWGAATQGLSDLLGDTALAGKIGSAAEVLGTAGKVLGPLGAVLGVATVANDVVKKDYGRAVYDGVATGLGIAALVTPPPADLALGIAAGGMALGSVLYDNVPLVHDIVDGAPAAIGAAADATGHAVGAAADATGKAIGDSAEAVAHGAEDFAAGVADTAKKFWPFG